MSAARISVITALLGLVVLLMPAAPAAAWQGALALGVQVMNEEGRPVPGARVIAEFAEVEPFEGPSAVVTDDSGQAVLYGLAEGLWRVQVEREGYSRYLAVVRLDAGRKKVIITAGPLREADAAPLTVEYVKSEGRRVAPEPPPRQQERRAERRRDDRGRETRREARPPEPAEPRATPERRVEPEPTPVPAPAPIERPAEPEAQPSESAAELSEAEPVPARPAEPEAAPAMPAPAPAPEPASAPRLPPSPIRSAASGSCADCRPGEAAVSARVLAAPGGAGCPDEVRERVWRALEPLATAPAAEAVDYAGPLIDGGRLLPWSAADVVARSEGALGSLLDDAAGCRLAVVVLPSGARFAGYRYQAADAQAGGDCLVGQDCPVGESRWDDHPRIERTDAGTFIFALFENRSPRWERRGEMTIYFKPGR